MLNGRVEEAINQQVNAEVYSGYLYYSMGAYLEAQSLKGCAHWMRVQALEELVHVQKFVSFVNDRGGRVRLQAVDAPPTEWESALAAFEAAHAHEVKITGMINQLMDLVLEEKDHASTHFMQWFVTEQVEEEASAAEIVHKLRLVETTRGGLFLLDQELNKRTFVLPPELTGVF